MTWEYHYEAVVAAHDSESPEFITGTKLHAKVQATVTSDQRQVNIKVRYSEYYSKHVLKKKIDVYLEQILCILITNNQMY